VRAFVVDGERSGRGWEGEIEDERDRGVRGDRACPRAV